MLKGRFGMRFLKAFKVSNLRAFYRPAGVVSDGQLADMVTEALRLARTHGVRDVLVDITELTGFESPGPSYRRWVTRRWAQAADKTLRVAVVARHEHICPQKTGVLVAAEEGLHAHICEFESEAIAWLDVADKRSAKPAKSSQLGPSIRRVDREHRN